MATLDSKMNTNVFQARSQTRTKTAVRLSGRQGFYPLLPIGRDIPEPLIDEQLRTLVKEKVQHKDYISAIALLNELIARHPDSAIDYNNRGLMFFYLGNLDKALADYNRAIALNSRLDSAYNNRANCYGLQRNFPAALADYEIALDLNPCNLKALINQGITLRELGFWDLALENFDLALILGCQLTGHIYAERGYVYYLRGDWNCAMADYQRALNNLSVDSPYREKVATWLRELLQPLT